MSVHAEVRVDAAGKATVTPDPIPVPENQRTVPIKWDIVASPGWTFTSDGIVIENNGGQFSDGHASAQGTTYHWTDKNDVKQRYKYVVNVTKDGKKVSTDPAIQNQA